jgi:hypothetical protein
MPHLLKVIEHIVEHAMALPADRLPIGRVKARLSLAIFRLRPFYGAFAGRVMINIFIESEQVSQLRP